MTYYDYKEYFVAFQENLNISIYVDVLTINVRMERNLHTP